MMNFIEIVEPKNIDLPGSHLDSDTMTFRVDGPGPIPMTIGTSSYVNITNIQTETIRFNKIPMIYRKWTEIRNHLSNSYGYWIIIKSYRWEIEGGGEFEDSYKLEYQELIRENEYLKQQIHHRELYSSYSNPLDSIPRPPKLKIKCERELIEDEEWEEMFKI